jgi:multimeric flavodoxin WrbA
MKLTAFNGSPRGKNSNSAILLKWILEGAKSAADIEIEEILLSRTEEHEANAAKMLNSELTMIIFPLYTDSMPGIVANFFEKLQPYIGKMSGRKLGFVVHSGFPEAHHSRFIEKYLARLTELLDAEYMGTVVFGGSEPVRLMPESMLRKKKACFSKIGETMLTEGQFDSKSMKKLAGSEKLSPLSILLNKFMVMCGVSNMYWNSELKKNNAFENRFAQPFVKDQ